MTRAALALALLSFACKPAEKSETTPKTPSSSAENSGEGQDGAPSDGSSEGSSVSSGWSGDATVYVVNASVDSICYVYLADANGWTDDLLGSYVLESGYYLTVTGVTPGDIELYAQGCGLTDWYGSGTVSSEYTFVLSGGDTYTYDTGYYY